MVWFDFGGVLSPPIDELFSVYEEKTGVTRRQVEAAMLGIARSSGFNPLARLEVAAVTQGEWASQMRQELRTLYPELDLSRCEFDNHGQQWFADHKANPRVVELVHECRRAGMKVGILTNNVVEWESSWREMLGLDEVLHDVVDSCKVLVRKPDPAIFNIAAKRNDCMPSQCLLIDDLEENCAAAVASGWHAIRFGNAAQTTVELRRYTTLLTNVNEGSKDA
jgi:putative hydrolase of the HAD superfamily